MVQHQDRDGINYTTQIEEKKQIEQSNLHKEIFQKAMCRKQIARSYLTCTKQIVKSSQNRQKNGPA